MNTNIKRVVTGGAAVAAVSLVVAGAWFVGTNVAAGSPPEPTPQVTEFVIDDTNQGDTPEQEADILVDAANRAAAERAAAAEAARVAAEQAAAQAAAEQAAAEQAARDAAARDTQRTNTQSNQAAPPAGGTDEPPAPIRCPAGSSANSNDGVNDTSCFPDICFSIQVPDPQHPECDVAFRP